MVFSSSKIFRPNLSFRGFFFGLTRLMVIFHEDEKFKDEVKIIQKCVISIILRDNISDNR